VQQRVHVTDSFHLAKVCLCCVVTGQYQHPGTYAHIFAFINKWFNHTPATFEEQESCVGHKTRTNTQRVCVCLLIFCHLHQSLFRHRCQFLCVKWLWKSVWLC